MMNWITLLILLSPAFAWAGDWCGLACRSAVSDFVFPKCSKSTTFYNCYFQIPQKVGTLALCCNDYCSNPESAWRQAVTPILPYSNGAQQQLDHFEEILANATTYAVPEPQKLTQVLYNPAHMSPELFYPELKAENAWQISEFHYPAIFAWVLLMFTGVVIAGAIIRHVWLLFRSHRSVEGRRPKRSVLGVYTKKYLLMPAIFHSSAHRPSLLGFTWSLPTRLQSVLVFFLVMINAISCGWALQLYDGNVWFKSTAISAIRYVGDRTGMMAVFNMPLLLVFAGRNNILIWLTGSSFETFNVFHKWLGRIVILQSIIHSALYTWIYLDRGASKLHVAYTNPYMQWGAVATVAAGLIFGQAVHVARKYYYETFLILHIVLAIVFIVGTWYHIALINYKVEPKWDAYLSWMMAACIIWALDRTIRVLRLCYINMKWQNGKITTTRGVVKGLSDGLFEIKIKLARDWKFTPGQYVFLHLGKKHYILQSHPFTIMSYEEEQQAGSSSSADEKSISSSKSSRESSSPATRTITLVVRQHKGVTKQLKSLALDESSTMLVEGPYGLGLPLQNYDNVTLLAGGVGITAILPFVRQTITQPHNYMHFIWVVHTQEEVTSLRPFLLKAQHAQLKLSIFITSSKDIDKKNAALEEQTFHATDIVWGRGRPVLADVLSRDAEEAGSWAVVACGPGRMLDDARAACVNLLARKPENIDFFSEGFEW